jgi:tetraacyldisaccharide 4'-kinase
MIIAARNRRFDRGEDVQRIDRPVISIGNITTGGTGKTPMVAWIARQLLEAGHHPVIAMRGYKARRGERSDEECEYLERVPDVPVLAGADRIANLRGYLPDHPTIDCILLDDGFQHRRLARDLDIVLIAAERWTRSPRLLPAGPWREPPSALRRADMIAVTRRTASRLETAHAADDIAALREAIRRRGSQPDPDHDRSAGARIIRLHLRAETWRAVGTPAPGSDVPDEPVLAVSAIADGAAFAGNARAAGATIRDELRFRDHHDYTAADAALIAHRAAGAPIVTTAKDWVKLGDVPDSGLRGWVLEQTVELESAGDALADALAQLAGNRQTK